MLWFLGLMHVWQYALSGVLLVMEILFIVYKRSLKINVTLFDV